MTSFFLFAWKRRWQLHGGEQQQISFTPPAKLAGAPILRCAAHDKTVSIFGRNDRFWMAFLDCVFLDGWCFWMVAVVLLRCAV
jgi:hypothetical protein